MNYKYVELEKKNKLHKFKLKAEMKIMHILFITSNYPTLEEPSKGAFVKQLVREISLKGIKCSVISPINAIRNKNSSIKSLDYYNKDNPISIINPRYFSFSNKSIFKFNTYSLTLKSFNRSVFKALKLLDTSPTIVYGHFLYAGGYSSVKVGEKLGIPSFVAVGESGTNITNGVEKSVGVDRAIKDFDNINGVITVSQPNTKYCKNVLKIPEDKIKELPNGIDKNLFIPHDKNRMREKYGLPKDKTIIAFTGHFDERKGPDRLLEAMKNIENIGVIFIGKGPIKLENSKILFKGILKHEEIPEFLSAADMFVLPTLAEGSCNAIIEAIGCGLPVVSSKDDFNDGILNDEVAIRIDPMNITEIHNAIIYLHENESKRKDMGRKALEHSENFGISERAEKILGWLNEVEDTYNQFY